MLAVAIIIFGVGQLVLPAIAAHAVRSRLGRYGRVISVSVSAFPAIELAFGDADSIRVHMAEANASQLDIGNQIGQSGGVSNLTVDVDTVTSGLLTITDARFVKHGDQLQGSGDISEASLRSAVPILESVVPLGSQDGQLILQGTADFLGFTGTADVAVGASNGGLAVTPEGLLGDATGPISVFSSSKVTVESVSGHATGTGLSVSATGRLN